MADNIVALDRQSIKELADALKEVVNSRAFGSGNPSKKTKDNLAKVSKKIEEAFKKASKSKVDEEKEIKKLVKTVSNSVNSFKDLTEEQKKYIKEYGTATQNIKMFAANLPNNALSSFNDMMSNKMGKLSPAFEFVSSRSALAAASLGLVAGTAGVLAASVMNTLETFSDLSNSGVYVTGGLSNLIKTSTSLNMSLDEFTGMATQYARVFNTSAKGLSKNINTVSKNLRVYGFTTKESAEYAAQYLDNQRKLGLFNTIQNANTRKSMSELALSSKQLSVAFGVSKEKILDGVATAFDDPMIQATLRSLPVNARKAFEQSIATFTAASPYLADALTEMVGSVAPQVTDTFQVAVQAGMGNVATQMAEFANGIKSGTLVGEQRRKAEQRLLKALSEADTDRLRALVAGNNQAAASMLQAVMQAKQSAEAQSETQQAVEQANLARARAIAKERGISLDEAKKLAKEERLRKEAELAKMREFTDSISTIKDRFVSSFLGQFGDNVDDVLATVSKFGEKLADIVKSISKISWTDIGLALGGVAAILGASKLAGFFSNKVINAGTVIVNGNTTGGFDAGGDGRGKKGKGKPRARRRGRFRRMTSSMKDAAIKAKAGTGNVMSKIATSAKAGLVTAKDVTASAGRSVFNVLKTAGSATKNMIGSALQVGKDVITKGFSATKNLISKIPVDKLMSGGKSLIKKIPGVTAIYGMYEGITSGVTDFMETLKSSGDTVLSSLTGLKSGAEGFFDGVIGSAADLIDFLSFDTLNTRKIYDETKSTIGNVLENIGSSIGESIWNATHDEDDITKPNDVAKAKINKEKQLKEKLLLEREKIELQKRSIALQEEQVRLQKERMKQAKRESDRQAGTL